MLDLDKTDRLVASRLEKYQLAKKIREQLQDQADAASQQEEATREAQAIIQRLAQSVQTQVHSQISTVVTRCLNAVFEEESYEFQIDFELKRGKTEAKLSFVRDGMSVDPLTASGGGVVDVASFALRLAALLLTKPRRRLLLVLDEPFRFVSARFRPRVATLLTQLSKELGVQIILVTHDPTLKIGKVVEL